MLIEFSFFFSTLAASQFFFLFFNFCFLRLFFFPPYNTFSSLFPTLTRKNTYTHTPTFKHFASQSFLLVLFVFSFSIQNIRFFRICKEKKTLALETQIQRLPIQEIISLSRRGRFVFFPFLCIYVREGKKLHKAVGIGLFIKGRLHTERQQHYVIDTAVYYDNLRISRHRYFVFSLSPPSSRLI